MLIFYKNAYLIPIYELNVYFTGTYIFITDTIAFSDISFYFINVFFVYLSEQKSK